VEDPHHGGLDVIVDWADQVFRSLKHCCEGHLMFLAEVHLEASADGVKAEIHRLPLEVFPLVLQVVVGDFDVSPGNPMSFHMHAPQERSDMHPHGGAQRQCHVSQLV
jgi:hypothetical protein